MNKNFLPTPLETSMKKKLANVLLSASIVVPLNTSDQWQVLKYSNLPGHKVEFKSEGMDINVKSSAGPLVYPLKSSTPITKIKVSGTVQKKIKFSGLQGTSKNDDFALRIGLVIKGSQTLSFAKKLVAPSWVKSLFALAPKGTGVDHIYFLNAVQDGKVHYKTRNHPLSKLIKENNKWLLKFDTNGVANFNFEARLDDPKETLAIWVSIDGDDTKSQFKTTINNITLN